jgi:hypothetical protein
MIGPGTMEHPLEPTADHAWVVDADGYDPLRENSLESRFAISNGFLGVRYTSDYAASALGRSAAHLNMSLGCSTLPAPRELYPSLSQPPTG